MGRDKIAGLITVVMTAAFFIALLWGYGQYQQSRRAFALLENEYQRAYYNYLGDLRDMVDEAGKARSVNGLQKGILLGRLNLLATAAADHMSQLPLRHSRYQRSVAYLNQLGDYAASLSAALARGQSLSGQDQQNLSVAYEQLQDIYAQMTEMETAVAEGELLFVAGQKEDWWQTLRRAWGGSRAVQGQGAALAENSADSFFSRADSLLQGAELLSYQGKYSAHLSNPTALGLYGKRQLTAEQGLELAQQFLAMAGIEGATLAAQQQIMDDTAIPLYLYHFSKGHEPSEDIYLTVSRAGGKIISYLHEHQAGQATLSAEAAVAEAEKLLAALGYQQLKLVSRQSVEGQLLLCFAPYQGELLCYPEGLELKLALDDGRLTALNTYDYWMNYHQRSLPADLSGPEQALKSLGAAAGAEAAALALIKNGAGEETLCYELRQSVGSEDYLVYLGAKQLTEEQVLRYYEAEDGSFYTR